MSDLIPFQFHATTVSTITDEQGKPWFVAKDVCEVLAVKNVSDALVRLKAHEKDIVLNDTLGGKQGILIINESGFYKLVLRSRKKVAEEFQCWVTAEVLPSIRKTGQYQLPSKAVDAYPELKAIIQLTEGLAEARQHADAAQALAEAAQLDARTAQTQASHADHKADLAMHQQQWLTIREFVYLPQLAHPLPEPHWKPFGTYLTGYCLENGIPVRRQGVADRGYGTEHAYHVEVMQRLLPGWTTRRSGQQDLR